MLFLRSLVFNLLFLGGTAVLLLPGLPLLMLPRRGLRRVAWLWARAVLGLLRVVVGLRLEVRGPRELLRGARVIAAKHQSAWDTIAFLLIAQDPAYVMKRELMRIPLYGWFSARLRMIPIDREGGGPALRRVMRLASRALAQHRQVVIFPQGTRVPPGTSAPYGPGTAALYTKLDQPVIPVALNSGLFWGRRSFLKRPGTVVVEILEPIAAGLNRRQFVALLEQRIEEATRRLEAEANGR